MFKVIKTVEPKKEEKRAMLADLNSKFVYTGGADAQGIWRKHGWTPPSEYRNDYLFKVNRDANAK